MDKREFLSLVDKVLSGEASIQEEELLVRYYESFQQSSEWNTFLLESPETTEEKLLQRKFALKNIAFAQSPFALKVEWCHDLFMQDDVLQIWRVLGNGVDNRVSEIVFQLVPM